LWGGGCLFFIDSSSESTEYSCRLYLHSTEFVKTNNRPSVYHNIIINRVIGRVENSVKIYFLYYYFIRLKHKKNHWITRFKKYKINNWQHYVQIKLFKKIIYTCSRVVRLYNIQSYPAAVSWRRPTTVEHISPEPASYYWWIKWRWATQPPVKETAAMTEKERERERERERDPQWYIIVCE